MASVFCTNCGGKHEYSGFAPNFCSKCGNSMNGKASSQLQKKPVKTASSEDMEDESEDNTNVDELPDIKELDVEIEMEGGFRAFNLEDLSRNPQAGARKFAPKRVGGIDSLSPTKYGSTKARED
jgi:hypothetical protein